MSYSVGPFDVPHLYLQWGGKLPGNEQWSCGLRMAPAGAGSSADAATMLSAATAAVQAFHTNAASLIHTDAKLSFVKLNHIDVNGHYSLPTTNQSIVADVSGGGGAGIRYPNQIAWAVTLLTAVSRGPAHKGRFYVPMPVAAVQSDGSFNTTAQDSLKGTVETMRIALNAINSAWKVSVMSRKSGSPANRPVTGTAVGKVPDTQRRRRRSLLETYR